MNVFSSFLAAALDIIGVLLSLYIWVLIVSAIMSWLIAFDVINTRNRFVQALGDILYRMTEPLLKPIRRFMPNLGGLDLSPLVLIFLIMFLQSFFRHLMVN